MRCPDCGEPIKWWPSCLWKKKHWRNDHIKQRIAAKYAQLEAHCKKYGNYSSMKWGEVMQDILRELDELRKGE